MPECTTCQRDLSNRHPIILQQDAYVDRIQVGQFCTYECLTEYIEAHDCSVGPAESPED